MKTNAYHTYGVPGAIVIAGLIIASAVFLANGIGATQGSSDSSHTDNASTKQMNEDFRLPSEDEHVRGDPDAPIAVVEFSDFRCTYCARLHPTMKRIVEENDDVQWIYRHFPLSSSTSSRSFATAAASECIARLGSNENFWSFADAAFENQRELGDEWYGEMARSFGIESAVFESCTSENRVISDIQNDLNEARAAGGRGTPFVVVVTPNENFIPFSGALPYDRVSAIIEQAREN